MSPTDEDPDLRFDSPIEAYERQAGRLWCAYVAGDEPSEHRFKWNHPKPVVRPLKDVREEALSLDDARTVIAQDHAFESWADLEHFVAKVSDGGAEGGASRDEAVVRFETAVEAAVSGDLQEVDRIVTVHPEVVHQRSERRHRSTLLHYMAANGVEVVRQRTPPNAVAITRLLLDAGAEVNAVSDAYGGKCTTLSMLVSSSHPAEAGLQAELTELLLARGANANGPGTRWRSSLMTALVFGFRETAGVLASHDPAPLSLEEAAGLGRTQAAREQLPQATPESRRNALSLAVAHGNADIVRMLLDSGESADQFNAPGFHAHSTLLHQAVVSDHLEIVRILVERGANLGTRDTIYGGSPVGWAEHLDRPGILAFFRETESGSEG